MADGRVRIAIMVDGKEVEGATDALRGLEQGAERAGDGAKKTERGIKDIVVSLGLVKIGAAAFSVLASSMDTAISRFDTLNTFPKVLQALGVEAEESERAMSRLSDGIDGLPTKLDEIASTAQRMYTSFNDMDKATDSALALNNALLGSGASADQAKRGTDQYLKALQTGRMEMDTWNSLSETMDVGLIKIAEGFGYAGRTAKNDLYNALQDGTITMDEFNDKLIEVGTGTGIMAELARENSLGIATSLSNLRNTAARGLADIIKAFNELSIEITGNDIAQNIDNMKVIINNAFKAISGSIQSAAPYIETFATGVSVTYDAVKFLSPALIGLATAYGALMLINKLNSIMETNANILGIAAMSGKDLTISILAKSKATAADTLMTAKNTGAITLGQAAIGVLTGNLSLATVAMALKTKATIALKAAMDFMTGGVGIAIAAIGVLVTGTIALVKWFNRATEDGERLGAETEALSESTESMNSALEDSSRQYERNLENIESSAAANKDLADRITELSEKENKSAADKEMLGAYVEQLNGQVQDLNLAYDEEADMMNLSSEQIGKRLDLMKEQEAGTAAQERLLEIAKEQSEVEQQLSETNQLREEWNQKLEEGAVKGKEHSAAMEELNESQGALEERQQTLRGEYEATEEQLTVAMENISAATEDSVGKQTILFSELSEAQQQTVEGMKASWEDYKAAATDMFDTLNEEAEITASEMAKNLEENQRIITEWSENIATLAERGVDEGLLETLRQAGPESAGHVNALVNASDEELERLSSAFAEGGNVATDALSKSLGIEESGVMDAVGHLVTDTESALADQIKSADFEGIGGNVAEGMADGISQQSIEAAKASERMGEDVRDATKATLGINSPSTVFKEFGVNITEGLALGINDGTSRVMQAIEQLLSKIQTDSARNFQNITKDYDRSVLDIERTLQKLPPIVQRALKNMLTRLQTGTNQQTTLMRTFSRQLLTPFSRTPSQFNSIGINAMAGLNAGLNAGRGRVMQTANNIAASVAYTMRQALRVASPSRVMRDDVGRWIPEGLADGIEKSAPSVYKALDKMTGNMMKLTTPELALGASRMGMSNINHHTSTSKVNQNYDNRHFTFNAQSSGAERDEREFFERVFREVKYYLIQEGGALGG